MLNYDPKTAPEAPAPPPRSGIVSRDLPPSRELAPWVASFWWLSIAADTEAREYTVPPDGCAHLSFRGGEVLLLGPRSGPAKRPALAGASWFGIRFQPGACRAFLGLPPSLRLRDTSHPAESLSALAGVGRLAEVIAACESSEAQLALAERWLLEQARQAGSPDSVVEAAVREILEAREIPTVGALALQAGLSPRQFRRRFLAAVDLSPMELVGMTRFRRCALELLTRQDETWTRRSAAHAFADQSHLIREFRRWSGLPPREFARRFANVDHPRVWQPARPE